MERPGLDAALDNPQAALKQIGILMVAESQRAFKAQQFGAKKWDQRAPVNVFGIIADFTAGKTKPPNRRFDQRPALRDTGRLSSSIAYQVKGKIRLGWLTEEERRGDTLKQTVPARPFIGITPETRKTITKAIGVKIMEVGK